MVPPTDGDTDSDAEPEIDVDELHPEVTPDRPGRPIYVNHGARKTWHHSVVIGEHHDHTTACGQVITLDALLDVRLWLTLWPDIVASEADVCDECNESAQAVLPALDESGRNRR